ncbi:glutamate-cysteine ligase catalytic subunit [Phakopsora pachyrhizi]|nr:glutamate-cysteine ligase catalytic subunit [Phakopsora pachyrhizi]
MGLLTVGSSLDWPEAKQHAHRVRSNGIRQFLNLWRKLSSRQGDQLLWGDEIEYLIVSLDHSSKRAKLSLSQSQVLQSLRDSINLDIPPFIDHQPTFHQEYGRYMIESTPGLPYGPGLESCLKVETNMRYRRHLIQENLTEDELPVTLTSFPRLGAFGTFTKPAFNPFGPFSQSFYLPDEVINEHVRFPTLSSNIRQRRGSKVAIFVPIFRDSQTPKPFRDTTIPQELPKIQISHQFSCYTNDSSDHKQNDQKNSDKKIQIPNIPDDHIYLDAMGFGMGCCCLQITFQAFSVSEARNIYDALVPIAPIMMSLSAAAPIYKGFLSDVDCRWNVISSSVDDRTEAERGLYKDSNSRFIPKSRYDSVSLYISTSPLNRPEYNDILAPVNEEVEEELIKHGIDLIMSRHIAHLFIRDPLVIFSEALEQSNEDQMDDFESIQSTNWQSVRFKPPPSSTSSIGWRVEFRTMEVQPTDFENSAYSVFLVLLTRAILSFGLNFYIPISKVDDNMARAQRRDSCRSSTFWFRKQILSRPIEDKANEYYINNCDICEKSNGFEIEYEEMTIDKIINGDASSNFPGLMVLVKAYVRSVDVEMNVKQRLEKYLELISGRASGKLMTTATFIRNFVRTHPDYKNDSIVTDQINYDLIKKMDEIEKY